MFDSLVVVNNSFGFAESVKSTGEREIRFDIKSAKLIVFFCALIIQKQRKIEGGNIDWYGS